MTPEHATALEAYGPCSEHRFSYVNVERSIAGSPVGENGRVFVHYAATRFAGDLA